MMFRCLVVDRKAVSFVCSQKTKDTIMTGLCIGIIYNHVVGVCFCFLNRNIFS